MKSKIPSAFTEEEIEAILLGLCWVMEDEESELAEAASAACDKLMEQLPEPIGGASLDDGNGRISPCGATMDLAVRAERKVEIAYRDKKGAATSRTIWPIDVDAWSEDGMVLAWCESRSGFRNFKLSRIESFNLLDRFPVRRQVLLARWQIRHGDDNLW